MGAAYGFAEACNGVAAPIATKNFTMGAETLHICCRSNLSAPIDFVNIAERSANDGAYRFLIRIAIREQTPITRG